MTNGLLSIRKRSSKEEKEQDSLDFKKQNVRRGSAYAYYIRGRKHQPVHGDFVILHKKKPKLSKAELFLKKFQYQNALDAILTQVLLSLSPPPFLLFSNIFHPIQIERANGE